MMLSTAERDQGRQRDCDAAAAASGHADASTDVTVVVASRNRRAQLLESLARHEAPVVLVDNGSVDGSVDAVRAAYPEVTVLRLGRNRGAVARNLGVLVARTPFVAFADDDSWWEPGALTRAAAHLRRFPDIGLLAARVLVGSRAYVDPLSEEMERAPLGHRPGLPGPDVLGFAACAAMVRRRAFLETGGFDPVVFFPGEEERVALDLAAAGWRLVYAPDVVVRHWPLPATGARGRRQQLIRRNRILTAVMRRPFPVVRSTVLEAVSDGRDGILASARVVPRLPGALRRRRRVPASVEEALARLT